MRSTMRREIARPRPVPPNLQFVRALGLLELVKDPRAAGPARCRCRCRAPQGDLALRGAGLDDDADAAALGELDRVAGEIEQHLAQPRRVAQHALEQSLVDVGGDLQALGLGARAHQLDHVLDQRGQRHRARSASSSLPASILEKSSTSSISDSSASPDVLVARA